MRGLSRISTVVAILCSVLVTACNSSTTSNAAAPTPVRCVLTLSGTPPLVESGGGTGTVALTINRECTWSAKPEVEWISVSPATGQGESQLSFSVARNQQPIERKGAIVVNEQRFEVTQRAACVFTLSPTEAVAGARGERLQVTVTTAAGCAWQAVPQVSWITVSAGASGTGPGTVALDVSANNGDERAGDVRIAGVTFFVRQSAPSPSPTCQFSLSASSAAIGSAGGFGAVDVIAPEGCQWTAQSSAAWLDVTSGRTGDGRGEVRFTASPNTSSASRTATLTIAGIEFRVTQAAAVATPDCTYSLSSTTESVTAAGGTGAITVTAPSGCSWTATSSATWLTVTAGASGSGNGTVHYSAAAHTGTSPRSASLTVATRTVTVNQEAAAPPVSSTVSGEISSLQGQCPTLTFVVNGRTVRTTSSTSFRGGSCNAIDDGDDVTVEGTVAADNSITATIVRRN